MDILLKLFVTATMIQMVVLLAPYAKEKAGFDNFKVRN